jgi:hypothetical protein
MSGNEVPAPAPPHAGTAAVAGAGLDRPRRTTTPPTLALHAGRRRCPTATDRAPAATSG